MMIDHETMALGLQASPVNLFRCEVLAPQKNAPGGRSSAIIRWRDVFFVGGLVASRTYPSNQECGIRRLSAKVVHFAASLLDD